MYPYPRLTVSFSVTQQCPPKRRRKKLGSARKSFLRTWTSAITPSRSVSRVVLFRLPQNWYCSLISLADWL
jgi:hypothetical protein